jgi:hypothetical protein
MTASRKSDHRSRLRLALRRLCDEEAKLVALFLAGESMARGSVYDLLRKCGKPSCACTTAGRLHTSRVVSWSEKGSTRLHVIPKGSFVEWRILTKRYQRFRRARARLVELHRQMLAAIGQLETARKVQLSWAATSVADRPRRAEKMHRRTSRGRNRPIPANKRSPP